MVASPARLERYLLDHFGDVGGDLGLAGRGALGFHASCRVIAMAFSAKWWVVRADLQPIAVFERRDDLASRGNPRVSGEDQHHVRFKGYYPIRLKLDLNLVFTANPRITPRAQDITRSRPQNRALG